MEYVGIIAGLFKKACKKARKVKAINQLEEVKIIVDTDDIAESHLKRLQKTGYLDIYIQAQYPDLLYVSLTSKAINNYVNWYVMNNR
jgi:hypothetical protein